MKLKIGTKILLGYVPVLAVTFVITLFTLLRLNQVNRINNEIVSADLAINEASEDMIETLLAQDRLRGRYMILRDDGSLSLLRSRDEEFLTSYEGVSTRVLGETYSSLASLGQHHADYNEYSQACMKHLDSTESQAYRFADSLRAASFNTQIEILNDLVAKSKQNQLNKTQATALIGRRTFRTVTIIAILGVVLAVSAGTLTTRNSLRAISALRDAANQVSQGKFRNLPSVKSKDEMGDLSVAFNDMADRLIQLEEIYMDSSPLTRLPGGIAIENSVKRKIDRSEPFAFCMMDLDNFKPFNDRYGYSRGNSVILATAKIIQDCATELGTTTDFVGHIGGDDFTLISTPERYTAVCEKIIEEFDRQIVDLYDPEDRKAKCITSKNRQGETLKFPIMTISISALDSKKSPVENHIQVAEIIAELKKYAKTFAKSNLVVDRRGDRRKAKKA